MVPHERFLTKLMGYDVTIEYKYSNENKVLDALSKHGEQSGLIALSQQKPWLLDPSKKILRAILNFRDSLSFVKMRKYWSIQGRGTVFKDIIFLGKDSPLTQALIQ